MRNGMLLRVTIILAIVAAINGYIGWHLKVFLSHLFGASFHPWLYWPVFWIVAFSYVIGRFGTKVLPPTLTRLLNIMGSYWLALIQFGILILPVTDVAIGVLYGASVSSASYVPILGWIVIAIVLILLLAGSYLARTPVIRKYEITIPKQAGDWKQLRVAVASDIHLGAVVGNRQLRKLVKHVNGMKPDLILLPGDVIDDDIKPFIRYRMGQTMRELQAPLGVYAVLGNHEYYGGHIPAFVEQMEQIGIRVLMDEVIHVQERLFIVGRKDKSAEHAAGGRKSLVSLMEGLDLAQPIIVMDHQPYQLDVAAAAGVDVNLSGHTHRGQIAPNHLFTRRIFELDWGYLRKGNLHALVSSGFGTWGPPIRLGSQSEIIELTLHFTSNDREEG
ncbi:3',5'-cyclic adenosine monophosphate phosphodiesterase CpdA [Paenibacillus allorhizoplanae]|uniref:3',5'-cyclic adenosine monophosphate phosphodiesterase CpdA n=1 Tax=Paenibacillus allorhizoplanae TaxID=2905648 RepID=A0ABM9C6D0_9BACL|nr:metallophosphoesterase [Paenibacillus allorhizoplanae]CAH1205235.1 3',5'-cyclic adenosine monophosphate phosphodiesterase CpdA [Paenibacillus allorhizoplanae]